jgi:hypothetical protein
MTRSSSAFTAFTAFGLLQGFAPDSRGVPVPAEHTPAGFLHCIVDDSLEASTGSISDAIPIYEQAVTAVYSSLREFWVP